MADIYPSNFYPLINTHGLYILGYLPTCGYLPMGKNSTGKCPAGKIPVGQCPSTLKRSIRGQNRFKKSKVSNHTVIYERKYSFVHCAKATLTCTRSKEAPLCFLQHCFILRHFFFQSNGCGGSRSSDLHFNFLRDCQQKPLKSK